MSNAVNFVSFLIVFIAAFNFNASVNFVIFSMQVKINVFETPGERNIYPHVKRSLATTSSTNYKYLRTNPVSMCRQNP